MPSLAGRFDAELEVRPGHIDLAEEFASAVVDGMLANGTWQRCSHDDALDDPLEAAVGSPASAVGACEHPAQRGGAAAPGPIDPVECVDDPPHAASHAIGGVERRLDGVVIDYRAEVAERAGDVGGRDAIDRVMSEGSSMSVRCTVKPGTRA